MNSVLGLVISNVNCDVTPCPVSFIPIDAYVNIRDIRTAQFKVFAFSNDNISFNYRKANYPLLYGRYLKVDCSAVSRFSDVDSVVHCLYLLIYGIFLWAFTYFWKIVNV